MSPLRGYNTVRHLFYAEHVLVWRGLPVGTLKPVTKSYYCDSQNYPLDNMNDSRLTEFTLIDSEDISINIVTLAVDLISTGRQ